MKVLHLIIEKNLKMGNANPVSNSMKNAEPKAE
jgi:hypothetical protein